MRLLCAVAAAALAASSLGCQAMKRCDSCGAQPCHIAQSQRAPRPPIQRTTCFASPNCGCDVDGCCGPSCEPCPQCGGAGCEICHGSGACCGGNACINGGLGALLDCSPTDAHYNFQPGPPVGQVAYPYYTTRGPRDFLARNPRSIGPTGAYGCPK